MNHNIIRLSQRSQAETQGHVTWFHLHTILGNARPSTVTGNSSAVTGTGWGSSIHKRTWAKLWEWQSFSLWCLRCWFHGCIPNVTTWQTMHLRCMPFTRHRLYFSAAAAAQLLSRVRLCDPVDCSPPGSSVHGILQARILEWVAISSSRGSSRPRDGTYVSCISCISRWILYHYCHLKLIKEGKFSYWEKLKIDESQK